MTGRFAKTGSLVLAFLAVTALSAYLTLTYIGKGQGTVSVPDLRGKDVVTVLELLGRAGLNTRIRGVRFSANIAANHVIDQLPRAGAQIKRGRDVGIVLSKGPATVAVPNLIDVPLQQARVSLEANDLCRGRVSHIHDVQALPHAVLAQFPPPGRTVPHGSCVDLLVCDGPSPRAVMMPDLTGLRLREAVMLLDSRRLATGRISSVFRKGIADNTVVDQVPPAGYRVALNASVNIRVNRRHGPTEIAASGHRWADRIFMFRLPAGFLKRHIRVEWKTPALSVDLYDGYMQPGEDLWLLVPSYRDATVLLYQDDELLLTRYYPAG